MSAEKTTLAKDIEALLSKSIEANKVFMSESTRMLKQFTLSGNKQNAFALNANFFNGCIQCICEDEYPAYEKYA